MRLVGSCAPSPETTATSSRTTAACASGLSVALTHRSVGTAPAYARGEDESDGERGDPRGTPSFRTSAVATTRSQLTPSRCMGASPDSSSGQGTMTGASWHHESFLTTVPQGIPFRRTPSVLRLDVLDSARGQRRGDGRHWVPHPGAGAGGHASLLRCASGSTP